MGECGEKLYMHREDMREVSMVTMALWFKEEKKKTFFVVLSLLPCCLMAAAERKSDQGGMNLSVGYVTIKDIIYIAYGIML